MAIDLQGGIRKWVAPGLIISVLTVVGMFAYYRYQSDFDISSALSNLDFRYVFLGIVLHIGAHFAWAARLGVLARGTGWKVPFVDSMRCITAGVFAASVTPARVGGDAMRFAILRDLHGEENKDGAASHLILGDRALDLLFFIAMGIVGAAGLPTVLKGDVSIVQSLAYVGIGLFTFVFLLIVAAVWRPAALKRAIRPMMVPLLGLMPQRGPRIRRAGSSAIDHVAEGMRELLQERLWLGAAIFLTFVTWILEFSILWVLLLGFGHDVGFWPAFFAAVLLNIITSVPLTPGGSGVAEVAALALYSQLDGSVTPAFVLVWRVITYYYDLIIGGVVAIHATRRMLQKKGPGHDSSVEG
jgi:uncharacterized protein (TIRG00374 family)